MSRGSPILLTLSLIIAIGLRVTDAPAADAPAANPTASGTPAPDTTTPIPSAGGSAAGLDAGDRLGWYTGPPRATASYRAGWWTVGPVFDGRRRDGEVRDPEVPATASPRP